MSWLSAMQGAGGTSGGAGAANTGFFSKIGDFMKSDTGKAGIQAGIQSGQQASATAAGNAQPAQTLNANGQPAPQTVAVGPAPSNYDPLKLMERLQAFKGR